MTWDIHRTRSVGFAVLTVHGLSYLQAKRWENTVGCPEIQKFVGALHGKRAKKGVNAWIYALGMYDPITDDGYRYSIEYWWFGVISQIVLGVLLTMYYLRGSFLQINAGWHPKLFWYSWGLQLVLWLILGFGPELNS